MGKRPPTDPQRFGDTSNPGSSSGWTDEKHMLYITFLEESFVNQLYSSKGAMNSAESFYRTPGAWQKTSYSGDGRNTKYDQGQGYWGTDEVDGDGAESRLSEVGYIGSPSCSGGSHYYMDDDASTNGPRQERVTSYHARQRNSGGSAAFRLRQHGHSFSWRENCPSSSESSDQNFLDGETHGSREQGRGSSKNQQKHADTTKVGPHDS
ncbi:cold-regulated protein 27-like isoform X1 [Miscanthus floridulus]|uniref:cold-regulated protein 27-like isoform X1 n=1 Tax=Miscanthus floridulus TaxID=154761 RepID=UPI00345B3942